MGRKSKFSKEVKINACKKYKVSRSVIAERYLLKPEEAFEIIPKEFPNLKSSIIYYIGGNLC